MTNTLTANGNTYTDDSSATTGLGNGGHRVRLVPMLSDTLVDIDASISTIQTLHDAVDAAATQVTTDAAQVAADKITVAADKATVAADKTTTQGYRDSALAAVGSVKVTASDTTPSVLNSKVGTGTGITKTTTNPGGDEVLTLAVDVGTAANKIVQLTADAKLPAVDGSLLTNLPATGFSDPMTTIGDIIIRNGSNVTTRLAVGAEDATLKVVSGIPAWVSGDPYWSGNIALFQPTTAAVTDLTGQNVVTASGITFDSTTLFGKKAIPFDGAASYFSVPDAAIWDLAADFTFEFWVKTATRTLVGGGERRMMYAASSEPYYELQINPTTGVVAFRYKNGATDVTASSSTAVDDDTWRHVCVERLGSSLKVANAGTFGSAQTLAGALGMNGPSVWFGKSSGSSGYFSGYMAGIRLTKGVARYNLTNFTPPTTYYPTGA